MRDREFVNRFCAFQVLELARYRDMDQFLGTALRTLNQETERLERLSGDFRKSLSNNVLLFGKHAFRKHFSIQGSRSVLNASLWDVMSTGLSLYSEPIVANCADSLREAFFRLMRDEEFMAAITVGPNDPRRVGYRFAAVRKMLREVIGANAA